MGVVTFAVLCGGDDVMAATARLLALHAACCNLLPTSASSSPSQHTVDKLGGSDPRGNRRRTAFSSDLHTVDEDEENRLGNLERGEVGRLFAVFAITRKVRLILTHTYTHAHSCHFISFILFAFECPLAALESTREAVLNQMREATLKIDSVWGEVKRDLSELKNEVTNVKKDVAQQKENADALNTNATEIRDALVKKDIMDKDSFWNNKNSAGKLTPSQQKFRKSVQRITMMNTFAKSRLKAKAAAAAAAAAATVEKIEEGKEDEKEKEKEISPSKSKLRKSVQKISIINSFARVKMKAEAKRAAEAKGLVSRTSSSSQSGALTEEERAAGTGKANAAEGGESDSNENLDASTTATRGRSSSHLEEVGGSNFLFN